MKSKSLGFSIVAAISALTLSSVAFGTIASAADTATPSPVISTDSGASDDAEISTLLSAQPVVSDAPEADTSSDANQSEDAQEQSSFDEDIKLAVLSGDTDSATQLTAAAAIVTSIDVPEIQAVASDAAVAQALILGLPKK